MAFGGLVRTIGLSSALVWQSMQSRVVPYVVAVDNLGQAQAVAPAAQDYRPTVPKIYWFLAKFITDIRARSLDPVLMRETRSEEPTSELQSLMRISYAVLCLQTKKQPRTTTN